MEKINQHASDYTFKPYVFNISRTDSFKAQNIGKKLNHLYLFAIINHRKKKLFSVCDLASKGVAAIFGPGSSETSGIVTSMAEKLEIPHFIYHWRSKPLGSQEYVNPKMTLNFYPESEALSKAFSDVLLDYTWKSYTIVYENEENLVRLKDVLQIHKPKAENPIMIERLDLENKTFGPLLKSIRSNQIKNIVLDISTDKIVKFLQDAKTVNMLVDYNKFFITNLDTHTLDLSEFVDTNANITTLRLVNVQSNEMRFAVEAWNNRYGYPFTATQMPLEAALVYDAVSFFGHSLRQFAPNPSEFRAKKWSNCMDFRESSSRSSQQHHQSTFTLLEFMRASEMEGLTGKIEFNKANASLTAPNKPNPKRGSRTEFDLDILEKDKDSFKKIAHCDATLGVVYDRDEDDVEEKIVQAIGNKTFHIAVRAEAPFIFVRDIDEKTNKTLEGNDRFSGYVVDLISHIQRALRFKYEFELVKDNKNGNYEALKNEWNGLIGEVLKGRADLAIADLTITYDRKKVVDFTNPFMNLGIGILYTKPEPKAKNLFSFLDPFKTDVWIYTGEEFYLFINLIKLNLFIGLAYVFISALVFLLSRINNDDWESSHPCNQVYF